MIVDLVVDRNLTATETTERVAGMLLLASGMTAVAHADEPAIKQDAGGRQPKAK